MADDKIWGLLVHLGTWHYIETGKPDGIMHFDEDMWDYILEEAPKMGINTILLDICAGIEFASHPEITLQNAWTRNRLRKELKRCKEKGLTVIPKLNFSAAHHVWLGIYSRMVSTPAYYQVCNDLIKEAYELFEHPEYIHIGMDEEDAKHTRDFEYAFYRQGELYWHDLRFLVDCVKDTGAKPWMWTDPLFDHPEEYKKRFEPDEVLLSPWYYQTFRKESWLRVDSDQSIIDYYKQDEYKGLDIEYVEQDPFCVNFRNVALSLLKDGYKYVPAASCVGNRERNADELLEYFKEGAPDECIAGYITTVWNLTLNEKKYRFDAALQRLRDAKEKHYGK